MAVFVGKSWFRSNLAPYLEIIKAEIINLGTITGQYSGKSTTFSGLPTTGLNGNNITPGDWSLLTEDDIGSGTVSAPQYPSGVYVKSTVWELAQESKDINDILDAIIASPSEVNAGTATDKVASVSQLNIKYAKIDGSSSNTFKVSSGNIGTNEGVNANQFNATAIIDSEAQSDWDNS
jgi:hypothetical protein